MEDGMREAEPSKMDAVTFCSSFSLEELIALFLYGTVGYP